MHTDADAHKAVCSALLNVDDLVMSLRGDPDPERRIVRLEAALTMFERALSAASLPLLTPDQNARLRGVWNELLTL